MSLEQYFRMEWVYLLQAVAAIIGGVIFALALVWIALAIVAGGDGR